MDVVPESKIEETVRNFIDDGGKHHIVFLGLNDFLKARGSGEFGQTVRQASLVIPTSKSILSGARFLGKAVPVRYMPFSFVIKVLGVLEKHQKTLYLVGQKPKPLQTVDGNLRDSFPGLRIVGRYVGYFDEKKEQDVVTAIKKAGPSLVLGGPGLRGRSHWFRYHRDNLSHSIFLWCGECFDIFAGIRQRINDRSWERGSYRLVDVSRKPWKLLGALPYLYYQLLLLFERIRHGRS